MVEGWPKRNAGGEAPPPYYEGDKGWSKERETRRDEITRAMDQAMSAGQENTKETLDALRALIDETEDATRNNLETQAGMTWIEQSKLVQGLLYNWYRATKDRKIE